MSVTSANGGGGGVLGMLEHFGRHLVDAGSQFWRTLDLGVSSRSALLDVFGATTKIHLSAIILLKSEKPNTSRNAKRIDPPVFWGRPL